MLSDTIAAISTPIGESGIGIIRISGPDALRILRDLFVPKRRIDILPYHLRYGHIVDSATRETIDEVLAIYMPAPYTYTREDIVEINCHGGPVPLQSILTLVLHCGARLAKPGEFTLRAFLNGRIDLAQSESVMDIVRAKTAASLRVAVGQLGGHLSKEIRSLRQQIMNLLAYLTATIDFAEDEIPEQDAETPLKQIQQRLEELLKNADVGMVYRQGVRTVIIGRPNVGKSSILNALLRESRAIVTPIPGTTRDTLEEVINLRGLPVVLVDTAGLTATDDLVERLGVERSRKAIAQADLVLLIIDGSVPLQSYDREIVSTLEDKPAIIVLNKSDLPLAINLAEIEALLPTFPKVHISALTGQGLADLETAIIEAIFAGRVVTSDTLLISNPRHKDVLYRVERHLCAALDGLTAGLPADFIAIDLTAAANALGEITGETVTDDLLETIFSHFCIGK